MSVPNTQDVEAVLRDFRHKMIEVMTSYPESEEKRLFAALIFNLLDGISIQIQLMAAEQREKFTLQTRHCDELNIPFLQLTRLVHKIPKAQPNSLYETNLLNTLYDAIATHFNEEYLQ